MDRTPSKSRTDAKVVVAKVVTPLPPARASSASNTNREESNDPVIATIRKGYKFYKKIGNEEDDKEEDIIRDFEDPSPTTTFQEGTVVNGPIEFELDNGKFSTIWRVQYKGSSDVMEELTVEQILEYPVELSVVDDTDEGAEDDQDHDAISAEEDEHENELKKASKPADDDTEDDANGDYAPEEADDTDELKASKQAAVAVRSSKRTSRPTVRFMDDEPDELQKAIKRSKMESSSSSSTTSTTTPVGPSSFEIAKISLLCMPTITEAEAEEALNAVGKPFGLNAAMEFIQKKRNKNNHHPSDNDDYKTNREKFQPQLGMDIRVGEGRAQYLGQVTSEGHMQEFADGGRLRMWEVTFEDGEKEQMDWNQLFEARAERPRQTPQPRGRPLECLQILSGDEDATTDASPTMVAQQFAQRMWSARTITNESFSTDTGGTPDFIWASPPSEHNCSEFTKMLQTVIKKHTHLILVVENPLGILSETPAMTALENSLGLRRVVVPYCDMGHCVQHPTHLWTNHFGLASTLNDFQCNIACPHVMDGLHPTTSSSRGGDTTSGGNIPDAILEEIVEYVDATFEHARIRDMKESNIGGPMATTTTTSIHMGYSFSKKFEDYKFYEGLVIGGPEPVVEETGEVVPNWRVRYDDGLEEDMTSEEILSWAQTHPQRPISEPETETGSGSGLAIGYLFYKRFGDTFFEGRIAEKVPDDESGGLISIWNVVYDDGDKEDLSEKEILSCPRDNPMLRLAAAQQARLASHTSLDKTRNSLLHVPGVTEAEVEAALKATGPQYSVSSALTYIHAERLKLANYKKGEAFRPFIGMKVRYIAYGVQYLGEVTGGPSMKAVENEELNFWEVTYEDGGVDDMTRSQLIKAWADRPVRAHPHRGRPLDSLELFSGCGVVSSKFAQRMWRTRSVDSDPRSNATDKGDFLTFELDDLGSTPDFIWASPPCFTYSVMAGGKHRSSSKGFEKTKVALEQNHLFTKMVRILHEAKELHPHLVVVIENPRGLMQDMPLMKELESSMNLSKVEVHYCAFGRGDQKPTHLWTNDFGLASTLSRFRCGDKCPYKGGIHPIGVRGQGSKFNAAAIPSGLAEEVAAYVDSKFVLDRVRITKSQGLLAPAEAAAVPVTDSSSENTFSADC